MSETNMAQADGEGEPVETMGRRLASLRVLRGWTQEVAAEKASTSQANLSKLEQDIAVNPPIGTVQRLATVYGVTIDYLVHGAKQRERVSA